MFLQATLTLFISFLSLIHCVSHSINLPSKRPWTPLPVSHNRQVNHQAASSPLVLPSSPSSTVYLPEKKSSSDVTFETHGKTYSIESSHFPTPIIEHHPNGATVGLDLPDSNIRLLLDIDQLGGKPVAQHIGLKVVEKNKKKQSQQSTDHKSEAVKINHRQPLTSNSGNSNSYGSSAALTSQNHQPQKGSLTASSSPQLTTVGRSSKIVQIPVSTNYKIGYIRTNDLHSAIHHQIVHGKGGNQVSVLSANYANQLLLNHHRVKPMESNVLNKDEFRSNQGGFTSPRLEQGSFKPIESYSNQMNKFDGQVKINNTNSSIKRLNIISTSKVALSSPVAAIKSKARINEPRETEQIKEPLQQQQVNDEQINQNDFNDSDMQIKFDTPTTISTNSRNQRSPKKLDKFEDVSEPISTLNSGSSLDNSNDITNADQGFDNDDDENNGESENITEDFNSRINNHKRDENKSAFDSEVIGKLTSVTNPPVNSNSRLMRGSFSCETITESFTSSTDSSLDSIARSLGAEMLLNLIPSSQSILQTLIDASTSGYTLFLPSNEALAKLPSTLINRWKSDSTALNTLWSSHFIDNQITLENLKSMNEVSLKSGSNQLQFGIFRNETYTVNGQPISIGNQRAPNNGIIHVIEGVLYPSADKDIMTTLKVCNKFDGFVTLAMGTGLASVLSRGGPYTVFVPSNEALQKIPEKDLQLVRSNMTALKDMLAYHVVPGLYYSSHLMDGQFINSLQSSLPIKVGVRVDRCSRRLVEVNMSPVYGTDIPASNGVIHVIDWIIKPNDNDWCDDLNQTISFASFPMDESKPILPNWPLRGSPISSKSSSCSSSTSTAQPVLLNEQTKLPVKQRVVFPSDRTSTSFGAYSDNINNNNKINKILPNNYNKNKNNDVKVKKHDHDIDDKQEFRDGWEFDSQNYRNPSPPIAERIGKNDNYQKRRQDYSNRYNDRRNYNNNNHRGNGFNSYQRSNHKFNGDNMPNKRRRNDSFETDDTFYIDWSDCNATTTNRTSNMQTAATQTSPKVQHQATQSSQDCNTHNPGPKKTTKDAILIDSWVRSLLGNNISYNQENGQSNKNVFSADTGVRGDSHSNNGNSSRATIDSEADFWAAELKDKAQVSSPKMDKPSVFARLGKPSICESDDITSTESHFQPVKQLYTEKNQSAATVNTLFNDNRIKPNLMKTPLPQEIPPCHPLKQPQKSLQLPVTSSQSQKPAQINIRDPRIRKRLSVDTVTHESSLPKRQTNETPLDSIPLIPLIPLELVEEVHSSCQKIHDKKPLVIDLS